MVRKAIQFFFEILKNDGDIGTFFSFMGLWSVSCNGYIAAIIKGIFYSLCAVKNVVRDIAVRRHITILA